MEYIYTWTTYIHGIYICICIYKEYIYGTHIYIEYIYGRSIIFSSLGDLQYTKFLEEWVKTEENELN